MFAYERTAMALLIKENCWKWDSTDGSFFVKYYRDLDVAEKVRYIHQKLAIVGFPYSIPLQVNKDRHVIIQPWIEGARSADYDVKEDRIQMVDCLQALHDTKQFIQWDADRMLPRHALMSKWTNRLQRFIQREEELRPVLGQDYTEIVEMSYKALKMIRKLPVPVEKHTLLHGDVVHHNIMLRDGEEGLLIDFDLASLGVPSDEMILWLQRALPNSDYNLKKLTAEHPYLAITKPKLPYLLYPNEVLREALFMLQVHEEQLEQFYEFLLPFAKQAISSWPNLQRDIEAVYA